MEEHAQHTVERHCDVLVVGGSAAGLAAALQLGRQRRSVIVVDAGEPRNAAAAHMHSYLGFDGTPPSTLTTIGRDEVRSYGTEVLAGRVEQVVRTEDGHFRAALVGGTTIVARRVLVATGIVDDLPLIDGVAEQWGRGIIHCPFCHGYEVRDRRIVSIITHPMGLHPAPLFRQLTDDFTVVVDQPDGVDAAELETLRTSGVEIVDARVSRVVTGTDDEIVAIELDDGTLIDADAVVIGPRFRVRTEPFAALGLTPSLHPTGLGDFIETDDTGLSAVAGVYAAGNVTNPAQQVLQAAANGSLVGGMIGFDLAREDLRSASRRSSHEVDWDTRYGSDRLWSGNPNGALVAEIGELQPGRALDVGAGEGGDAVWLAERGWDTTANDISQRALDRIGAAATERGHHVEGLHADANASGAFGHAQFDLVTAHYASIPKTADGRGIGNLLAAVAPGGTLLFVSHDVAPMRAPLDTRTHSRAFDPDAYVLPDDIVAAIADDRAWTIEVDEVRPRPAGSASAGHHVDDRILRARRAP